MEIPALTTAIVLACDRDFLVPTVGVAVSARESLGEAAPPVLLYLADPDPSLAEVVRPVLAAHGVTLRVTSLPEADAVQVGRLHPTHVTPATMMRLWLDELLPAEVTRFLYLDGDIDLAAPLGALLATPVPQGGFLAAPDLNLLVEDEIGRRGRRARAYLAGLGIARAADYFNAGVLLADRAGWRAIAADARAWFRARPERCPHHDQSALNAVAGARRRELSLAWNWQTDFMLVADPARFGVTPGIWHFTGFPKPWQASFPPWRGGFGRCFARGAALLAPLRITAPEADPAAVAAAARMWELADRRLRRLHAWRRFVQARRIRAALRRCPP